MAQFLMILSFLKAVAPMLEGIYNVVRDSMPAGSPGAAKLDAFKGIFTQAVSTEEALAPHVEAAWPYVVKLIAGIHLAKKATAQNEPAAAPVA